LVVALYTDHKMPPLIVINGKNAWGLAG
jgi:hypothetical protein